jgi:hypothetical protein
VDLGQAGFEGVEMRRPEMAVPLEPLVELAEPVRGERVDALLAPRLDVDQPRLAQDPQVARDRRLGQRRQAGHQLARRPRLGSATISKISTQQYIRHGRYLGKA